VNGVIAVLLVVVAVNPVRRRSELPSDLRQVAVGAGITFAAILALGLAGEPVLDALDITVPTFRVAVGLVLAILSVVDLIKALPPTGPVPAGLRGAVAPVFFPVLLRPEVGLVAVLVGADAGLGWLLMGAVLALLDPIWWAERTRNARLNRAFGAVLSVAAIVLAVDLLIDGVFAL
jgi:small neutral amino acid transporter SnatA (MarC family)